MGSPEHHDEHGHDEHHRHHHHHHHHHHGDDFDWEAMVDALELDGGLVLPIVERVVTDLDHVDWPAVRHVIDIGCGPGVIACALARHAPNAEVVALDSSAPLLDRTAERALDEGLGTRVRPVQADLEEPLPVLPVAEVVWASMVLHHVADPLYVLRVLADQLMPGGTLVMTEFAAPPVVLPDGDPASEAWHRLQDATAAARRERLGLDPLTVAWPTLLAEAGYVDVTDELVDVRHPAPLHDEGRRWLERHLSRGLELAGDQLAPDDVEQLTQLARDAAIRDDLFALVERRILIARRPD